MTRPHVVVDDAAFLRVPVGLAYMVLTDVATWSDWWPDVDVHPGQDGSFTVRFGRGVRAIVVRTRPSDWRHDRGLRTDLDGDVVGRCEW